MEPADAITPVIDSHNFTKVRSPFPLKPRHVKAARLLAEGKLTNEEIAAKVGVSRRALQFWLVRPEWSKFQAVLEKYLDEFKRAALLGISRRDVRVMKLADKYERFERFIIERGASEEMQTVPGGSTGMVAKTYKIIGTGKKAQLITEYEADTGLSAEMRQVLEQIARECGHRDPKSATAIEASSDGAGGLTVRVLHIGGGPTPQDVVVASDQIKQK